jgi:hypothetical protein
MFPVLDVLCRTLPPPDLTRPLIEPNNYRGWDLALDFPVACNGIASAPNSHSTLRRQSKKVRFPGVFGPLKVGIMANIQHVNAFNSSTYSHMHRLPCQIQYSRDQNPIHSVLLRPTFLFSSLSHSSTAPHPLYGAWLECKTHASTASWAIAGMSVLKPYKRPLFSPILHSNTSPVVQARSYKQICSPSSLLLLPLCSLYAATHSHSFRH